MIGFPNGYNTTECKLFEPVDIIHQKFGGDPGSLDKGFAVDKIDIADQLRGQHDPPGLAIHPEDKIVVLGELHRVVKEEIVFQEEASAVELGGAHGPGAHKELCAVPCVPADHDGFPGLVPKHQLVQNQPAFLFQLHLAAEMAHIRVRFPDVAQGLFQAGGGIPVVRVQETDKLASRHPQAVVAGAGRGMGLIVKGDDQHVRMAVQLFMHIGCAVLPAIVQDDDPLHAVEAQRLGEHGFHHMVEHARVCVVNRNHNGNIVSVVHRNSSLHSNCFLLSP